MNLSVQSASSSPWRGERERKHVEFLRRANRGSRFFSASPSLSNSSLAHAERDGAACAIARPQRIVVIGARRAEGLLFDKLGDAEKKRDPLLAARRNSTCCVRVHPPWRGARRLDRQIHGILRPRRDQR